MIASPFSRLQRGYILAVLTLVYALNMVDRQIVIILQDQIKKEFLLSDKQLGLMTGLAFVLLYATCSLLLAPLADRYVRRSIISGAIVLWSAATASAGLAQNYAQMLLARVGVGVGESGSGPAAYSMIADMFPEGKRGFPTALFSSGGYLGILFGFAGGGWLGATFGWRYTLILLGIFGIGVALLVRFTVPEPARQPREVPVDRDAGPSLFRQLLSNRAFAHLLAGSSLYALVGTGSNAFMPSYLIRVHGFDVAAAGFWLGPILGLGGAFGSVLSGIAADRIGGLSVSRYPLLIGAALLISVPFYMAAFFISSGTGALLLYCIPSLLYPMYLTPTLMVAFRIVPPEARARASAVVLTVFTGIGLGLGPLAVGALSDYFTPRMGPEGLRYALAISAGLGAAWGLFHQARAYRLLKSGRSVFGETAPA